MVRGELPEMCCSVVFITSPDVMSHGTHVMSRGIKGSLGLAPVVGSTGRHPLSPISSPCDVMRLLINYLIMTLLKLQNVLPRGSPHCSKSY